LIEAKINPRFVSISANTAGIIFLGTPHRGSDVANLGTVVATIVSSALPGIRIFNREVLRDLKSNNHTLFGISSQFSNICSTMTIHSFHETMPMGTTIVSITHYMKMRSASDMPDRRPNLGYHAPGE
jgi:hypothetical protein